MTLYQKIKKYYSAEKLLLFSTYWETLQLYQNLLKCGVYPFVQAYCMVINFIFLRDIKVNGPEEVLLKYLSSFSCKFGQREVRIFGILYTEKL